MLTDQRNVISMTESVREPYQTFYNDESVGGLVEAWIHRHSSEVDSNVHSYLVTHAGRFAYTAQLLRRAGSLGRLLDIGGTPLTEEVIGGSVDVDEYTLTPDIDLEIDPWADMVGSGYDVALCAEVIQHMNADPAFLLQQANSALRPGGLLVVSTVNIASMLGIQRMLAGESPYAMGSVFGTRGDRHHREYSANELLRLVVAQGFEAAVATVDLYEPLDARRDADRWVMESIPSIDPTSHGDTIVVVGRKVEEASSPRRVSPVYHHSMADFGHSTLPDGAENRCLDSIERIFESSLDPALSTVPRSRDDILDERYECPCCQTAVKAWRDGPNGRPNAACPNCFSLERHRLLAVVLKGMNPFVSTARHVLEYAPQPQIRSLLMQAAGDNAYTGVDLMDDRWIDSFADACAMPFDDDSFDLIVCFHILEHIPDDAAAMREMARVLTPGGIAVVQVPSRHGPTDEDPSATVAERIRRFGQDDHVRYYGDDFIDRLRIAGLDVALMHGHTLVPDDGERARFGILDHDPIWVCRSRN